MNTCKAIEQFMKENGFFISRKGKHLVWKNRDGATVVTSRTPSDHRALKNIESLVRKIRRTNSLASLKSAA